MLGVEQMFRGPMSEGANAGGQMLGHYLRTCIYN